MTIKTTGAEWKAFQDDQTYWPADGWFEDEVFIVDGEEMDEGFDGMLLEDSAKVTVEGGVVYWAEEQKSRSLTSFFKAWRRTQSVARFAVECPKEVEEAVRAAIAAAGGKVAGQ